MILDGVFLKKNANLNGPHTHAEKIYEKYSGIGLTIQCLGLSEHLKGVVNNFLIDDGQAHLLYLIVFVFIFDKDKTYLVYLALIFRQTDRLQYIFPTAIFYHRQ